MSKEIVNNEKNIDKPEFIEEELELEEELIGELEPETSEVSKEITEEKEVIETNQEGDNLKGKEIKQKVEPKKLVVDHQKKDTVEVRPMVYEEIITEEDYTDEPSNIEVIMSIPLEITIEIGRTKRQIKDIMAFRSGSVIDLDKQVGDLVDLVVNGQLIAKGEVVVVNDNYGIRIADIIKTEDLLKLTV